MNVSEYRDDDSQRLGTGSPAAAKFIQICASQNDLFALDEEGNIYQYNFNAKTWEELVANRSHEGPRPNGHRPRAAEQGDRGSMDVREQDLNGRIIAEYFYGVGREYRPSHHDS